MTRRDVVKTSTAAVAATQIGGIANARETSMAGGLKLRPASKRGMADHGWLKSAHSFSFASYFDPENMQFETLRVINDDQVAPGAGFPAHPHRDVEIFSYVLSGALEHKDSLGNGSVVKAGGIQYMSAGSGVRHSEFNPSSEEPVHFLQIWLLPDAEGGTPRYDTMDISDADKDGKLKLFLSKDGRDGSMKIKTDADIYASTLNDGQSFSTQLSPGRKAWIQVAKGQLTVNGQVLTTGDGLAISEAGRIEFTQGRNAEFIYFDLESS